jgi:hypothetical protein
MKRPDMLVLRSFAPAAITVAVSMGLLGIGCNNAPVGGDEGDESGGSPGAGGKGGAGGKSPVEAMGGKGAGTGGSGTGGKGAGTGGAGTGGKGAGTGGSGTGGSGTGGTGPGAGGSGSGGTGGSGRDAGPADGPTADARPPAKTCNSPDLVWKTAQKTWYTSYPQPGSEECIKYSGCKYQGMFNVCGDAKNVKSKEWVMAHNIVAMFPLGNYGLHDLCLKSGTKTIVVTVLDTCGDNDCGGCCTQNKGSADALIDLESFTNMRWGVSDGRIQWADLGPTTGEGCFGPP